MPASILSIHFHYAVLFTTSPLTYSDSATTWQSLARETAGYEQLEKARDAAIDVIRGICSVSTQSAARSTVGP
jgi:hypothetical protein